MDLPTLVGNALALFLPLFVAMDPVGALPLVLAWTGDLEPVERERQLRVALLTAVLIGFTFLLGGAWLLGLLGITVADFMVAGGAVLLVLAIADIVVGGSHEARGSLPRADLGAVPIGIPILMGPATLTTLLIQHQRFGLIPTALALLVNLVIAWRLFRRAGAITERFGQNGLRAASKVASLLLAAIAVRLIREGIATILQSM